MHNRAPSATSELLERLIAPVGLERFFEEYWGKKVLYLERNDPSYYNDVLTFADVDDYLSRTDLRYPYIRLVQGGRELPLNSYAYDSVFGENLFQGNLDLDRLFNLYQRGATMCMQLQHLALPKLRAFTNRLERFFQFRTQSTLFLTPPKSQGFTAHFDSHDFFIFQIHGEKDWKIYGNPAALPLARRRVLDTEVLITEPPTHTLRIKPGDCLYVPRGVYHEALTSERASLQISLGVFPYIWTDVLHKMIDDLAAEHLLLREAVETPLVGSDAETHAAFDKVLHLLRSQGDPTEALSTLKRKSMSKQVKCCENRLGDLERLPTLGVDDILQKRPLIQYGVTKSPDAITLFFYDKELTFPAFVEPDLSFILSGEPFRLADLPGDLDDDGRSTLVRRLIEEGLLQFQNQPSLGAC